MLNFSEQFSKLIENDCMVGYELDEIFETTVESG